MSNSDKAQTISRRWFPLWYGGLLLAGLALCTWEVSKRHYWDEKWLACQKLVLGDDGAINNPNLFHECDHWRNND